MMGANPGLGRIALVLLFFLMLAIVGGIVSMMMGSVEIPLQEILDALAGAGGTHAQILWNIRLPRTLVAALVARMRKRRKTEYETVSSFDSGALCRCFVMRL